MVDSSILPVLFFLAAMVMVMVTAQQAPDAPLPAAFSGYVKHKNKFYVYGGMSAPSGTNNSFAATGQFYALDLSKPWKSESPAWIRLPEGPKENITSIAISTDGKVMVSFPAYSDTMRRYNFDSRTWGVALSGGAWFHGHGLLIHPITVPTDGNVLLVQSSNVAGVPEMVNQYSFSEDKVITGKQLDPWNPIIGPNYLPAREAYQAAWSSFINLTIIYGGNSTVSTDKWVSTYDPLSKQWSLMLTTGNPEMTSHHCGAISDDGKTFFSYGGRGGSNDQFYRSSLFILDLPTRKWTQGADSKLGLIGVSCTVAGDYFLLWGGATFSSVIDANKTSTPVRIYQISQSKWIEEYQPSIDYLEPATATLSPTSGPSATSGPGAPPGSGSRNPSSNGSGNTSTGAIAGGAAGGTVVVLVLIVFLVWKRRRQGSKDNRCQHGSNSLNESDRSRNESDKPRNPEDHSRVLAISTNAEHNSQSPTSRRPQRTPSSATMRSPQDVPPDYEHVLYLPKSSCHGIDGDIIHSMGRISSSASKPRLTLPQSTSRAPQGSGENNSYEAGGLQYKSPFPDTQNPEHQTAFPINSLIPGSSRTPAPLTMSARPSESQFRYPKEAFPQDQPRGPQEISSYWENIEAARRSSRERVSRRSPSQ